MSASPLMDVLLLLPLASVAWLWWFGSRVREHAVEHARRACRQHDLQLLDQTVALRKMRLARDHRGRRCLRRSYHFEFTGDGEHRDGGEIHMLGDTLQEVYLPWLRDDAGNRVFLH